VPILGRAIDLDPLRAKKCRHGSSYGLSVDVHEPDSPQACLKAGRKVRSTCFYDVDDVKPVGHGVVEHISELIRVNLLHDADLEVLSLARSAGGGCVGIGDLRVRIEAGTKCHRHIGTSKCALKRTLEVSVARKSKSSALGVTQTKFLYG
jgi:hypothetical protein